MNQFWLISFNVRKEKCFSVKILNLVLNLNLVLHLMLNSQMHNL